MLSTRGFCFILPALFYPVHYVNAEWVEYINDASLNVTHTDNLNQSAFSADEEADTYITPSYTFGRFYQATDLTRLRLSASVSANSHNEFSKLNSVDINGAVAVSHKFGIGWKKPWLRGEVSTGYKQAKVDLRDSNLYQIGVSTGKRLNKRLSAQASLQYNKRNGGSGKVAVDGKSTQVFDINNSTLGLMLIIYSGKDHSYPLVSLIEMVNLTQPAHQEM